MRGKRSGLRGENHLVLVADQAMSHASLPAMTSSRQNVGKCRERDKRAKYENREKSVIVSKLDCAAPLGARAY